MPVLRTYQVFISHAWHRGEHYDRVVEWLDDAPHFSWHNLSVPEHDPIHAGDDAALKYELNAQMRDADIFLILAGMYSAQSYWIGYELNFARRIGRPVVGVAPWASKVMPAAIQNGADYICGWNSASVVSAVRDHALRG